ncbi:MAG: hypothetical protein QOG85_2260 [Gaiellaceae bacterium]|jgi:uncharacterized protein YdhG (YjbR/CyaY superfamily)|nr:hypothetical protein [Gaiellaceae bacterium]
MSKDSELHQELAQEKRELKEAVTALRTEIDETAKRGKKVAAKVGAALLATFAAKKLLKLKNRNKSS